MNAEHMSLEGEKNNMIKLIIKQQLEINRLKLRIAELEDMQKSEVYQKLLSKYDETATTKRLKTENKHLREKLRGKK